MGLVVGLDEVARGCVVAGLYVAGVMVEDTPSNMETLKSLGVKDSKMLSKKKRETIFPELIKNYRYGIKCIPPNIIDQYVGKPRFNLNYLEATRMAEIIDELAPTKAIIDCPDIDPPRFERTIKGLLHMSCEVVAEYKADKNYPIVSAASIIAKVTRDNAIEELRKVYGQFGSGYPSDPRTVAFFKDWLKNKAGDRPSWTRRKWSSWEKWETGEQDLLFPVSVV